MKPKIILIACCLFGLFGQTIPAQNANQKTTATAPKHYPNPYETPDPNRPVDQNPSTWKDFPANISSSNEIQAAYAEALKNKDGYRLLQLAKIEYDNTWTYGKLDPNKMLQEAYYIAVNNKDPFLALYITEFNTKDNHPDFLDETDDLSAIKDSTEKMAKTTYQLALERKEVRVLNKLADIKDMYFLMESVSSKDLRKQALFINNKNYAPYPNPYDTPNPDKPLNRSPFIWKDFPTDITTETQLKTAYNEALKTNDGYKLLQLAKVASDKSLSKTVTAETLLTKAYAIAQYNKDPYLMIYITLFEKEKNLLKNAEPVDIFRNAYNTAVERIDTKALRYLYSYEQDNDFLQDITPKKILQKMQELDGKKPII